MTDALPGGCRCGALRFAGAPDLDNGHICRCRMCRKAVGSAVAAHVAVPNDAFRWTRGTRT